MKERIVVGVFFFVAAFAFAGVRTTLFSTDHDTVIFSSNGGPEDAFQARTFAVALETGNREEVLATNVDVRQQIREETTTELKPVVTTELRPLITTELPSVQVQSNDATVSTRHQRAGIAISANDRQVVDKAKRQRKPAKPKVGIAHSITDRRKAPESKRRTVEAVRGRLAGAAGKPLLERKEDAMARMRGSGARRVKEATPEAQRSEPVMAFRLGRASETRSETVGEQLAPVPHDKDTRDEFFRPPPRSGVAAQYDVPSTSTANSRPRQGESVCRDGECIATSS